MWIWSARQSQGRGRGGREWVSQQGNLFASLLVGINCPIRVAGQLALVAGIIAFDTIAKLIAYEGRSELLLKWPNDILLAGEKVAGMLLENIGSTAENRSVVVIGTGINLANHPEGLPQPAISLAAYGMTMAPAEASKCWPRPRMTGSRAGARAIRSRPSAAPGSTAPDHRAALAREDQRRGDRRRLWRSRCRWRARLLTLTAPNIGSPPATCSS